MRRDAREAVCRFLYSYFITNESDIDMRKSLYEEHKLNDKDVEYADTLIDIVIKNEEEFTENLSQLLIDFDFSRLNLLDRAALFVAMSEIKFFDDIDVPVSIDEAVNFVKKYSTDKSPSFVNGVLASYARKLNEC